MRHSNRWIMHGLGDVAKWSIVDEPDEDVAEGCTVEEHPRGVGLASFVVAGGDVGVERLLMGHREGSRHERDSGSSRVCARDRTSMNVAPVVVRVKGDGRRAFRTRRRRCEPTPAAPLDRLRTLIATPVWIAWMLDAGSVVRERTCTTCVPESFAIFWG